MKTLLDFFKNNKIIAILILLVSIPIVLYPRFDMQDISLVKPFVGVPKGELTPDQRNYLHFVEYFRGEMPLDSCHAPYSFRPLVPFTASLLPFKPMTSIKIVNTFSVILTVIFIFLTLKRLHFDFELMRSEVEPHRLSKRYFDRALPILAALKRQEFWKL